MNATDLSLSTQLVGAAQALAHVDKGHATHQALAPVPMTQRAPVQALLFHALRHWGWSRAVVAVLAKGRLKPQVQHLLAVALPLLGRAQDGTRYDAHTVVNQAVAACKAQVRTQHAAGLVNACLRRFLRDGAAIEALVQSDVVAQYNHPAWWVEKLRTQYPQQWREIAHANHQAAPMVLRVNVRHHSQQAYQALLAEQGWASEPVGEAGLVLAQAVSVERLPGFHQGWVSVQDASAQMAAALIWASPRLCEWSGRAPVRILDACAAPGGKTAHLLEKGEAEVTAIDVDATRLSRVHDTLARLGLSAHVCAGDAAEPGPWQANGPWDAILLDAPCSASGIVRRHPDIAWLRRQSDVDALVQTQARLLDALWPQLAQGGRLVYATCSVFQEEGESQAQAFVNHHPDAQRAPAPGHWLPQRLEQSQAQRMGDNVAMGFDGFFYAAFDKR
jgi:16S rRNA (cytosine967-C5)-methyltransferase